MTTVSRQSDNCNGFSVRIANVQFSSENPSNALVSPQLPVNGVCNKMPIVPSKEKFLPRVVGKRIDMTKLARDMDWCVEIRISLGIIGVLSVSNPGFTA